MNNILYLACEREIIIIKLYPVILPKTELINKYIVAKFEDFKTLRFLENQIFFI